MHIASKHKTRPFILNFNSRISWSIFKNFVPLETGMHTFQLQVQTYLLNGFWDTLYTMSNWNDYPFMRYQNIGSMFFQIRR